MTFRSLLVAGAALALAAGAHAETLYLTAARMADPASGKAVDNPAVVITDDRITAAGTAGGCTQTPGGKSLACGSAKSVGSVNWARALSAAAI